MGWKTCVLHTTTCILGQKQLATFIAIGYPAITRLTPTAQLYKEPEKGLYTGCPIKSGTVDFQYIASITRNKEFHLPWWPWHSSSEPQHRWHRNNSVNSFAESKTKYYNDNQLKANPAKTHVSLFHLRNREVGRKLSLTWNGVDLKHCDFPVYLGVTLDRTLSYKQHIEKVKGKMRTKNNLLH